MLENIPTFQPRLKVFNKKQALAIHDAAVKILDTTGFCMEHDGVLELLLDNGCSMDRENRVTMPESLIEKALLSAPKTINIYDQNGNLTMPLEGENFFFGTGSDTIFTIDLETGKRRRTLLNDTGNFARLVDALPNMDFSMSMGNPEDVEIRDIYIRVFEEMVQNSNKPICFIADSGRDIRQIHEIACTVAGGEENLRKKPFLFNYSEAISPLHYPENVMEKLVFCAEKEIPICLPSGCNAGGGGPVTLAGAMAQGIAENLVGLVVHQLTHEGAPFLFAPNVSVLDMKYTVVSYGCTEWSLTQAAFADMRDELYQIPIWSFAGATDAKILDAQAGAEAMLSIVTSLLSRCNVIHDVGYIESGHTSSLEMLTMADELVGMAKYFAGGIPVNEQTLALDVIDRVSRSADNAIFLSEPHTFAHFRQAHFLPDLMDRARFEIWEKNGKKDLLARCNEKTRALLASHDIQKTEQAKQAIPAL
ncbi:trimethylamine methyltransferase family protein [Desulfospira joergensenii]|uniref:trimethylamine methyltransferase family protein n=1 Tax=Desulfospira joergensenii TaxID=53329 RepID=UPI0003B58A25|nr:trimethylamine methyltransferase family protein [Desulfospira joergensenii]